MAACAFEGFWQEKDDARSGVSAGSCQVTTGVGSGLLVKLNRG